MHNPDHLVGRTASTRHFHRTIITFAAAAAAAELEALDAGHGCRIRRHNRQLGYFLQLLPTANIIWVWVMGTNFGLLCLLNGSLPPCNDFVCFYLPYNVSQSTAPAVSAMCNCRHCRSLSSFVRATVIDDYDIVTVSWMLPCNIGHRRNLGDFPHTLLTAFRRRNPTTLTPAAATAADLLDIEAGPHTDTAPQWTLD